MTAPADITLPPEARSPRQVLWTLYVVFWLAAGLFQGIAELQHYVQRGGVHRWEPFLWELSSTLSSALLVLPIFAGHRWLFAQPRPLALRLGAHFVGVCGYVLGHSALMVSVRAAVYAAAGMAYAPGDTAAILAYEGAKDLVSYALIVALSHGVLLFLRDQQRRADWLRLNTELAAARLARLQEQIQPHFLFNALNLVSSVMYEDVERADRLLAELSDLLRLSLEAGRHGTHSLRAELRLVEPYLSIMRQRFEDRLDAQVEISDAALACELPSLLLMAPLENAVKHGVARCASPVQVRVQGSVQGGVLDIQVRDNAPEPLPGGGTPSPTGGIGLRNTRERLAAMYGGAASVQLTREGDTTVLHLRLPARPAA